MIRLLQQVKELDQSSWSTGMENVSLLPLIALVVSCTNLAIILFMIWRLRD
jgi:hypothetical protein